MVPKRKLQVRGFFSYIFTLVCGFSQKKVAVNGGRCNLAVYYVVPREGVIAGGFFGARQKLIFQGLSFFDCSFRTRGLGASFIVIYRTSGLIQTQTRADCILERKCRDILMNDSGVGSTRFVFSYVIRKVVVDVTTCGQGAYET